MWLLFREGGGQVGDLPVVFDARDDGDAGGSASTTLLEFWCGAAGTGDSNNFCGERLRRRGAAAGERSAIGNFDFDFVQRQFGTQLADEILRAALQFLGGRADHSYSGDFVQGRAKIGPESGFESGDGEFVHSQCAKQRIAPNASDPICLSPYHACLPTTQQFLASEPHAGNATAYALFY